MCDDATQNDGGLYTLTNTFDLTLTPVLPVQVPTKVFTKILGELPSVFELVVSQVETGKSTMRATLRVDPARPSVTHHYVFQVTLVAEAFGDYELTLIADGDVIGSTPWVVRPLTPPE
jgi:hypothetical protein